MKYRHGDVTFHTVKKVSGELVQHDGSYVVAYGEATGHHHTLTVKDPVDLEIRKDAEGRMFFVLHKEGTLTHEEHGPIVVAPGTYEQKQEREYDWFALETRRVVD